jgi:hypothetical protein
VPALQVQSPEFKLQSHKKNSTTDRYHNTINFCQFIDEKIKGTVKD